VVGGDRVRRPAVAGTFYPSDGARLTTAVEGFLRGVNAERTAQALRGVIVPHAGYRCSGPIAASAYSLARPAGPAIERIVLIGPSHFCRLHGAAVPAAAGWRTPLGLVRIDRDLVHRARSLGTLVDDEPHASEHALEVQLPFIQVVLGTDIPILPVAVGVADATWVADLLRALVESGVLLIVSTDLSHYHPHETATRLDQRTSAAISARDANAIAAKDVCGIFALRGAVEWSRRADLAVRLLDRRTSADTVGDASRVVGYGAFAIE
jgi:AmmeMemoRadiSam system protein B